MVLSSRPNYFEYLLPYVRSSVLRNNYRFRFRLLDRIRRIIVCH